MFSTFYRIWSVAILAVSVLIFCVTIFLVLGESKPGVALMLTPDASEVEVGKTFSVAVGFIGKDADKVNATDIVLKFDRAKLKLEKALAGPYFTQPLIVKWDLDVGKFSLAANPTVDQPENSDMSILRLEFKAQGAGETEISFGESDAYVVGFGGVYPTGEAKKITIN